MGTVSKGLGLLTHFDRSRPQSGLSEFSRLSGLNKTTCFRLLSELAQFGLVEQLPGSKEYRLGPAVLRLAALREVHVPTRVAARPVLQALAHATGETAHLSQLVAGKLVTLGFAYPTTHGVGVMMEDADILPFHATASGHAVLAFLPEAEAVLSAPLATITRHTPVDPITLRERVAAVRKLGWAETLSTFQTDVASFAVPLFSAQGLVQGAMAVAAAAPRLSATAREDIPRQLIAAARAVMALWGGQIPPDLAALWRVHP